MTSANADIRIGDGRVGGANFLVSLEIYSTKSAAIRRRRGNFWSLRRSTSLETRAIKLAFAAAVDKVGERRTRTLKFSCNISGESGERKACFIIVRQEEAITTSIRLELSTETLRTFEAGMWKIPSRTTEEMVK